MGKGGFFPDLYKERVGEKVWTEGTRGSDSDRMRRRRNGRLESQIQISVLHFCPWGDSVYLPLPVGAKKLRWVVLLCWAGHMSRAHQAMLGSECLCPWSSRAHRQRCLGICTLENSRDTLISLKSTTDQCAFEIVLRSPCIWDKPTQGWANVYVLIWLWFISLW